MLLVGWRSGFGLSGRGGRAAGEWITQSLGVRLPWRGRNWERGSGGGKRGGRWILSSLNERPSCLCGEQDSNACLLMAHQPQHMGAVRNSSLAPGQVRWFAAWGCGGRHNRDAPGLPPTAVGLCLRCLPPLIQASFAHNRIAASMHAH